MTNLEIITHTIAHKLNTQWISSVVKNDFTLKMKMLERFLKRRETNINRFKNFDTYLIKL